VIFALITFVGFLLIIPCISRVQFETPTAEHVMKKLLND